MPVKTISDTFFESVLESAPDAMIIVDSKGSIAIVNEQAERMFGYTREQMLGEAIELLVPTKSQASHREERTRYLKSPRIRMMGAGRELFGRRKDGTEFPAEISLSPVQTDDGLFVSSAIRDVTERKNLERDIVAARHEAERANKANTAFLAAASHDLRQPVQALSLLNGALMRTVKDPDALEMIGFQSQSITAMTNLLNSLLDISRLDAGAIEPDLEDFPASLIIDRLTAEFSRQASQKGLTFSSTSSDAIVRSDVNLLSEIIQNLVSNGVRYTEKGSVELECKISDAECRLSVKDTGIGIEADQLEQIFAEFHQCNVSSSNKEGFGLGLAIVRRLADLLGHAVEVQSTPGEGSRFTIVVPLATEQASQGASDTEDVLPRNRDAHGFVLLVEDDPQVSGALRLLFESAGYTIALARSSEEAHERLEENTGTPDLIVSDYHLASATNGVAAAVSLRNTIGREIPVFILSGDTSELIDEAKAVTNCELMSKPVNPDDLLAAAGSAIAADINPDSKSLA